MNPFTPKEYRSGEVITVGSRQYILDIEEEDRGSHGGKLVGNTVALHLSSRSAPAQRAKAIKTLLSRIVAADFQSEITQRVLAWNLDAPFHAHHFSGTGEPGLQAQFIQQRFDCAIPAGTKIEHHDAIPRLQRYVCRTATPGQSGHQIGG